MESTRQEKVGRLVQREVSEIFQFEMQEIAPGAMLTITKVYVTRDLSIARVYISIFGKGEKKEVLELVRERTNEIRYRLGNRIRKQVRITPNLEFYEDDSLDYIDNIESLLDGDR
jgi:ribosome-binding factor A